VQAILDVIYPDWDDDSQIALAHSIIQNSLAQNWLDAVRQLLLEGLIGMEQSEERTKLHLDDITPSFLQDVARRWRREAQEVLVHTFDYLYFYENDPEYYVRSIWHTWCTIPNIGDRIPEYVLRTLCAISARFLDLDPQKRRNRAKSIFEAALAKLATDTSITTRYAEMALRHVRESWDIISDAYDVRLYLSRLMVILHSDTIGAKLYSDSRLVSGVSTGYNKRVGEFDFQLIENPLRFLRENLVEQPTEADSLWVLSNIAFNLAEANGA
jgi:hypothetical protein